MKRLFVVLSFAAATMLGCAQNYFNIPAENFAEKVKVLGVAPIFLDADSDINYPQKDLLIALITSLNRKYEPMLARKLQSTGNFYTVTLMTGDSQQLFSSLMARREKRDDASIQYNKYFWKSDEVAAYARKNRLDAVMVIVISGLTKNSKIYSSNLLTSLETNFNFLTMTAQILGPDGTVLWEYPNFRRQLLSYYPLINLQYPDFSESEANLSRKTEVRFKSIDGIRRTLEQKRNDWLLRETQEPEVYGRLFDEMTSLIRHDADRPARDAVTGADDMKSALTGEAMKSSEAPQKPAAPPSTATPTPPAPTPEQPAMLTEPAKTAEPTEVPAAATSEAAPATGSSR